ncbi:short chain dehydrogenase [Lophiostoma macrostomum CBS 122681]|uniref:Short chain dehydrogenase n=1 Tax=Lophiostoma macrostomum CBS 122681 TaxID=1314788 RepID=A0A6A6T5V2_9PLEO|nr:short chain dehydrogenase [Lophiostoma macrostomum CBS 122681]
MEKLADKTIFIVGGSGGLGVEIARAPAGQGAHITIFGRRQGPLDEAKKTILASRLHATQETNAVSADMSDASEVDIAFKSQPQMADALYCVAGGTVNELGFLADIDASNLEGCMRNNYFTAAHSAMSMWKAWIDDDKNKDRKVGARQLRQVVFINSAGAFVGLPGYITYAPSKCAVRALADTLRMEALRYSGASSTYTVHCAFPSNFITETFFREQEKKPALTKELEGTTGSNEDLQKRFPSEDKVALGIINAVAKGEFAICEDSLETALLFSNMIGPSPKRGFGILDSLLSILVGLFIWPVVRRRWDSRCKKDSLV